MFFFLPEKKKFLPRKFSIFRPRRFETVREKILKTAREEKFVPEKKQQNSTREKKFFAREKKSKFPPSKHQNTLKFLNFSPRKIKCNPRKNLKIYPRKFQNARENFGKSGREKYFSPEKKTKKKVKNWFLGHFSFSRVKKKHWLIDLKTLLEHTYQSYVYKGFSLHNTNKNSVGRYNHFVG